MQQATAVMRQQGPDHPARMEAVGEKDAMFVLYFFTSSSACRHFVQPEVQDSYSHTLARQPLFSVLGYIPPQRRCPEGRLGRVPSSSAEQSFTFDSPMSLNMTLHSIKGCVPKCCVCPLQRVHLLVRFVRCVCWCGSSVGSLAELLDLRH